MENVELIDGKVDKGLAEKLLKELSQDRWYTNKYTNDNNGFKIINNLKTLSPENQVFFSDVKKPQDISKQMERAMLFWLQNSDYKPDYIMVHKLAKTRRKKVIKHLLDTVDINEKFKMVKGGFRISLAVYCIKNGVYVNDIFEREDFNLKNEPKEHIVEVLKSMLFKDGTKKYIHHIINDLPEFLEYIKINDVKNNKIVYSMFLFEFIKNIQGWENAFKILKNEDISKEKPSELENLEQFCIFIDFLEKNELMIEIKSAFYYQNQADEFHDKLRDYSVFVQKKLMEKDLKENNDKRDVPLKSKIKKF